MDLEECGGFLGLISGDVTGRQYRPDAHQQGSLPFWTGSFGAKSLLGNRQARRSRTLPWLFAGFRCGI